MYTIYYSGLEFGPFHLKAFAERCMKTTGINGTVKKCESFRIPIFTILHEYNILNNKY
ncbi:MAG: hypothetical protein II670_01290 [Alphaproteobacteria bacterium]|nr:hypothetical protein [Alphaproteobacteria bacterium]